MTSRERVQRALRFQGPDRAPFDLWHLAGVGMLRRDELDKVVERFPVDFAGPRMRYGTGKRSKGSPAEVGEYVDEWGCVWSVAEIGVCGEVKRPPLEDWSALASYTPPWEVIHDADFSEVNASCGASDKFMRSGTQIRPFERLQFLRGTENLLMDLAWQPKELFDLIEMVHDYFLKDLEKWVKTDVDGLSFMDDWGAQSSLLISPDLWRQIFKPLYKQYCDMMKAHGKAVFFHSDGYIMDIYPELIELGVDAVNSQLFCMDIEEIARLYKGKITFWGEICRQRILPFGTVDEVREAVRRVRHALDDGKGGLIAQCEWGNRDPRENVEAVYETWLESAMAASV